MSEHVNCGENNINNSSPNNLSSPNKKLAGSQAESEGVSSTMETVPSDMVDGFSSEDERGEEEEVWGRLVPSSNTFTGLDLSKDEYSFGRDDVCDYQFNSPKLRKHSCFQAFSKVHFRLSKEKTSTGIHVFLKDTSSNGTFINGDKIGKGNRQVLNSGDEIALALKSNKAWVYLDPKANDSDLPEEIRERYTLSKELGRGACGEVKLAFAKGTCKKYAVKIISKKQFTVGGKNLMDTKTQVMGEVNILTAIKHPCVIRVEDVIDTEDTLYIVLELVEGGELFDRIVAAGRFTEYIAKLHFYQMALAVKYLHDQGITHRDLKPENILLATEDDETLVKVTDFGLSKFVDAQTMMKTFCGTPNYLAPEILQSAGMGAYTKAIDCWSLGVILYICLVGYPPFGEDRGDMPLRKQIETGSFTMPDKEWKNVSQQARDLVSKLLVVDPGDRITLADTLNHPWFKDEKMKTKAQSLMYPDSETMAPPTALPKKRRADSQSGDEISPKKLST